MMDLVLMHEYGARALRIQTMTSLTLHRSIEMRSEGK